MPVAVKQGPFDPWAVLAARAEGGGNGATACFVGTMRDLSEGEAVEGMTLEHYPGMTDRYLESIEAEARRRWDISDALIVHRVGEIVPGEAIVLVAVWAAHRKAAFEACRYLIEELKHRAPFWKKERLADRSRWVRSNTPG
ncbi:MAG: molybdenum cofactor biosynthesis protein MoaE [Gammaproteobacteria bacterium]|nr:molybdenum cofactor biosynthesis protein MoaE [Gammaproteobacteria bacterium]